MVPLGCGGGIEIEANLGSDAGETRLYDIGSILSSFILCCGRGELKWDPDGVGDY